MPKVGELVSSNIENAITNFKTWGGLAVNVVSYGADVTGEDDSTTSIQAAIDYAISIGKVEVYFPAGTYTYGVLTNTTGMTFIGDGVTLTGTTVLNLTSIAALSAETVTGVANIQTGSFGAVGNGVADDTAAFVAALAAKDVVFVPFGYTYLIGDVDVVGKKIFGYGIIKKKSTSVCAFHLKGTGARIEDLTFYGQNTSGQPNSDIKLGDGAKDIRIRGCTFKTNTYSAISAAVDSLNGGTPYAVRVSGVRINMCTFSKDDTETLGYSRPIFLHSVDNFSITNNLIRDTAFDAIRLRENSGFGIIDSNQFLNIGDPSWPDTQTRDAVDTYWSGSHLTITNNMVDITAHTGFDIKGYSPDGSYGSSKVIIANNQIYRTRFSGISLAGDDSYDGAGAYKHLNGIIVNNNIVQECNQSNASGAGSLGDGAILLKQLLKNVNITNNYVISNFARGIYAANIAASKAISKNINILNNLVVNNGYTGDVGSYGIYIAAMENCKVRGNICDNDSTLTNPYQAVGIYHVGVDNGYTASRSVFIDDNSCSNNTVNQITCKSSGSRIDSICSFWNNYQTGTTSSDFRASWQNQRGIFFGSATPTLASEGVFQTGAVVFNTQQTNARNISHWIHQGSDVWKAFGSGFGTTAQRPTLTANDNGYSYMDSTLAKMIFWNGTAWLV